MQVMLLSLWSPPGSRWHARLVEADAHVHEFDSPFELARFLAQARPDAAPASNQSSEGGGLR